MHLRLVYLKTIIARTSHSKDQEALLVLELVQW
jgi:hypothetical protein